MDRHGASIAATEGSTPFKGATYAPDAEMELHRATNSAYCRFESYQGCHKGRGDAGSSPAAHESLSGTFVYSSMAERPSDYRFIVQRRERLALNQSNLGSNPSEPTI